MGSSTHMATIKDVAKAANVSTATVSRVINQSDSVLPETVAKVESVMAQLGYQIKDNRRLTINQGQDTIGLIVSRFHSPFYGLLTQGVEKIAKKHGRKLIVASGSYDIECEEEALKFILSKGCRNIIVHSKAMTDEMLIRYAKQHPGIIIINRHVAEIESQCVWLDNSAGTYLATKHLIEQGHRKIAYLSCEMEVDDKFDRFNGYQQALAEAGIEFNPDWVEEVPFGEPGGAEAAINLLNKGLPVTALVAFNDFYAAAAMQVFKEHGIEIPQRLSIVGFDDVLPQCYFSPKLTTIRSPIESMAMNAARLSLEGCELPVSNTFHPLLIKRDSVQKPFE
ncbi:LacI family DNA-binding transcriptional regulator [Photobacterium damselae subsp. damselae]|uniref:LacI family DNA-binding transcriptional regulator n=1 Tax=Photobacterium damselae TaxID=38293 RepID=UPI001F2C9B6D|nr:LacI family DNA-binding transcriptional regulator [Photobacterium damselae]UJZ95830.1 LacI family DNA-binding transcriptional regulator [Photobacterium damselae subsp. damselae]UKA00265.1 LacI family DNA-binding transcriptional regulator [Photobacterium damselae subsp. damselae]